MVGMQDTAGTVVTGNMAIAVTGRRMPGVPTILGMGYTNPSSPDLPAN